MECQRTSTKQTSLLSRSDLVCLSQGAEACSNLFIQLAEDCLEVLIGVAWHLKLHAGDLHNELAHGIVDHVPGDLIVTGALSKCLLGALMEVGNHPHHTNGLDDWALEVAVSETILLEEIFADDLCNLKRDLLILRKGVLSNKLNDLLQVILLLEDLLELLLEEWVLRIELGEVWLQDSDVLGEGDVPVDRREVLPLCELLVQTPEDLHDAEGG